MPGRCEGRCGRGRIRSQNQDNIYVNGQYRKILRDNNLFSCRDEGETGLYAVCDGMGGEAYGEEAALLGVQALIDVKPQDFPEQAERLLRQVNGKICRIMEERDGIRIGTTFVAFSVYQKKGCLVNIGDSRGYLFRSGRLEKLSRDHTQVQTLVDMGMITGAEADIHPKRHVLTQHLGIFPEEMVIEPHISQEISLQEKDLVLLCSDGLTDMVSERKLKELLSGENSVGEKADALYERAMERGGKDNISVVLLEI